MSKNLEKSHGLCYYRRRIEEDKVLFTAEDVY